MTFELSTLALRDTTELHIKHPVSGELLFADEEKTQPIVAHLYGPSSKVHRNAILKIQNRALQRNQKKQKATAEQMREENVDLLVACSDKIDNLTYNGKTIDTPEVFREVYGNSSFSWLKEQVEEGLGDVASFLEV